MRWSIYWLCLALIGCGSSTDSSEDVRSDSPSDTPIAPDVAVFDAGPIADVIPDLDSGPDLAPDGGFDAQTDLDADALLSDGETCEGEADCSSGLCVAVDPEELAGFCTTWCSEERDCPSGTACARLPGVGADFEEVCLPDDLCVDPDGDDHGVGPACINGDCDEEDPSRYVNAPEVCDGVDNDCDDQIDNGIELIGDLCESDLPGECTDGFYTCEGGVLDCVARNSPVEERCDAFDNDCDGLEDEGEDGEALQRACYTGAPATDGIGECEPGLETCEGGEYSSCAGQVLPTEEVCNGDDDDCDGLEDEGDPGSGDECVTGDPGVCSAGVRECLDGGARCVPVLEASEEICDRDDNDCDGEVDESEEGELLIQACYSGSDETRGVGECSDGTETCLSGEFDACAGQVLPTEEICNGLDDDCDGREDEGDPEGGGTCPTGVPGQCSVGTWACSGGTRVCTQIVFPETETCDGEDNDCDTFTDENDERLPLSRDCYTGTLGTLGVGVCEGGTQACTLGAWADCEGQTLPGPEVCDGRNNDCDADGADEGDPGGGLGCSTGIPGVCAVGTTACAAGAVECVQNTAASAETCDGFDEDCDGLTDEDDGGLPLTLACYTGPAGTEGRGECVSGGRACFEGEYLEECVGDVTPVTEVCNGRDDDCDLNIDDGCPILQVILLSDTSPLYGAGGGSLFSDVCPLGQVIVGINVRSETHLDQFQAVCGTTGLVEDDSAEPYEYSLGISAGTSLAVHGGTGGDAATYLCPANQMVSGIFGASGMEVDRFGVRCASIRAAGTVGSFSTVRTDGASSSSYGGPGGTSFDYSCPDGAVMTGVYGRSDTAINAIGGYCSNVTWAVR